MLTRRFTVLLAALMLALALPAGALAARTGAEVMADAAARLKKMTSLTASYSIATDGRTNAGTITVEGRRFKILSRSMSVWYDGKTQWTAMPADGEVDITEPTAAELQQVNPFAIIDSHARVYNAKLLKASEAGTTVVQLTPRNPRADNGGIARVAVTLDATTLAPRKLVVTMTSRAVLTITVSALKAGGKLGEAAFRPTAANLKGLEVVDLR